MAELHDVKFHDGTISRVGAEWIKRWPEDIAEIDGHPFEPAAPDSPETETTEVASIAEPAVAAEDPTEPAAADAPSKTSRKRAASA